MNKKWQLDVGAGLPSHVHPIEDEIKHQTGGSIKCWCKPVIKWADETGSPYVNPIVVHNSADMRELVEQAEAINNQ